MLTPAEADQLFRMLALLRYQGKTVILFTHKLREYAHLQPDQPASRRLRLELRPASGLSIRAGRRPAHSLTDATMDTIMTGIRFRRNVLALPLEQVVVNYQTEHADHMQADIQGIASPGNEVIPLDRYGRAATWMPRDNR